MRKHALTVVAAGSLLASVGLLALADDPPKEKRADQKDKAVEELLKLERDLARDFMKNNAAAIDRVLTDDWVVIGDEGDISDKPSFLGEIKSGSLVFEMMKLDDMRVRVYGDAAVVTGRATVKGKYNGQAFSGHDRWTDVFVKQAGRWQCVSSQLTRLGAK